MDILTLSTACILCAAQPSAPASITRWNPTIADASARFAIPESWIARVMQVESGGRAHLNGHPIASSAGAMGLMQIMPGTYAELRQRYRLGSDPDDPRDNILAGAAYLRAMYVRYGYPYLFAAYNAGPGRLDDFLFRNRPLPHVTLDYIRRIVPGGISAGETATAKRKSLAPAAKSAPASALFFALSEASNTENSSHTHPSAQPMYDAKTVFIKTPNTSMLFVRLTASPR